MTNTFENNIRQTWDLVYAPGCAVEIRALLKTGAKVGGKFSTVVSGYFDNYEAFRAAAMEAEKLKPGAVYVTLNPVKHDLTARAFNRLIGTDNKAPTTSDKDIIGRRLLLIDADPLRPAGISSTDPELAAALAVRDEVAAYLHGLGFPPLKPGMSGNGGHLLGMIDLPNDEQSEGIVKDFLQCLDLKFGRGRAGATVGIDTTVYNAARITKLYGTTARKGDSTPTRPHRDSYLCSIPEQMEVIPVELLQRVADEYRAHKAATTAPTVSKPVTSTTAPPNWSDSVDGVERYLADHGVTLQAAESYSADGYQYKWVVDCVTSAGAHKDGAIVMWGAGKGLGYKCHHDSCNGKGWADVRAIIDPKQPYVNGHYSGFGPANVEINIQPARADGEPVTSGFVGVVAELLRVVIDAGGEIDTLRDAVARLSDNDRKQPVIIAQLERVFAKPDDLKKWLTSCGYHGQSQMATWITALRRLGYKLALNMLEDDVEIDGRRLDDITRSRIYLEMKRVKASRADVDDTINVLASEEAYHPVQQYLAGLVWDGKNHVGAFLQCIIGDGQTILCKDVQIPLHQALISRWLLGCVARALDGNKDTAFKHQTPMLVFVGEQGKGKSALARWLCSGLGHTFHQEGAMNPHKEEDKRSMVTKWIWEVSELGSSLRRADREAFKGFITQEWQTYRKPWGRGLITKPILCNLIGTLNSETGFLDDPTGHRRFLPVQVTGINWDYKEIDVNQLWAQVVHEYRSGVSPDLSDAERGALSETYKRHEVENPLQTYLTMYFDINDTGGGGKTFTAEIIDRLRAFGVALHNDPRVAGKMLNDALAPMGLKREYFSSGGVKGWGWAGIAPNGRIPPQAERKTERGL